MTALQTSVTLYRIRLNLFLLFLLVFVLLPVTASAISSSTGDDSISQQKVAELIAQDRKSVV